MYELGDTGTFDNIEAVKMGKIKTHIKDDTPLTIVGFTTAYNGDDLICKKYGIEKEFVISKYCFIKEAHNEPK